MVQARPSMDTLCLALLYKGIICNIIYIYNKSINDIANLVYYRIWTWIICIYFLVIIRAWLIGYRIGLMINMQLRTKGYNQFSDKIYGCNQNKMLYFFAPNSSKYSKYFGIFIPLGVQINVSVLIQEIRNVTNVY